MASLLQTVAMDILIGTVVTLMILLGLLGVVVPILPGHGLIVVAVLVHRLLLGEYSWWVVIVIALLGLIGLVVDAIAGVVGARWLGASRWGVLGAIGGLVLGIFWGLPGVLLGPLIGAVGMELLMARQKWGRALRAGTGVLVGWAMATVIDLFLALLMVGIFLVALFY